MQAAPPGRTTVSAANFNQQPAPDDPVLADLVNQIAAIEQDPNSLAPSSRLWRFSPKAQARIDRLRRKVADRLAELREQRGEPVDQAGYTGPKQKRR